MNVSYKDLIINPNQFFAMVMSRKENLKIPGLIVLAAGVIAAVNAYIVGGITAKMMGQLMPGMDTIIAAGAVAGAIIGTLMFWLIRSGVIYALSAVFKGSGGFQRTLECIGYGYLPQAFGTLITLVAATQYVPKVHVTELSSAALQDPAMIETAIKAMMQDPAMRELSQISSVVTIIFLLLSANIWIFGIRNARMLSLKDAAICVLVPVIAFSIYTIYQMTVM
jgi:hypothetical protein